MTRLNPGQMNVRVQLQAPTRVTVDGRTQIVWSTVEEVWASVIPLSGRELARAWQIQPDVTHQVRLWYRDDLRSDWRLLTDAGQVLELLSPPIDVDARHVELELLCREPEAA